ncbi:MAG: hypothetical protein ACTHMC_27145 [Pseudobacter sp.]|uniref:hypothetical protein n=1 Tax=Pseudobacter sp. TaxID=2045420 RepID=UPI003F7DE970
MTTMISGNAQPIFGWARTIGSTANESARTTAKDAAGNVYACGTFQSAYQQYTTGYLRKEYSFKTDGTYTFRKKNFLSNSIEIYFVYETGTYTVNGNQLTITPQKGSTGFWNKPKSLKNNEWGGFVKPENHKLEKVTYTFDLTEDPNYSNSIVLKPGKATVRDGGQFNATDDPYKFHYSFRKQDSLIDNPPGFKK